ncbi:(Fe-S)-binding protein [Opitutaceae bacterium TAV4]|nr:(Fe-S)-binding protein [Opitutaceae bacterium TAV4]RRK02268.1 (Fe-S)-binding protein [Opitutaceae bacterium TAV3]
MNSAKFIETIHACRFCFMCRHLSAVGNVTFREADTPRGRALMLDKSLRQPQLLENADFQSTLYDADLSAACRFHCVSHYDETGLLLAARRDVAERGAVPQAVRSLAEEIRAGKLVSKGPAQAETVYYVDRDTEQHQPEIAAAMERIFKLAGIPVRVISGADTGKALAVLGFWKEAGEQARNLADAIGASAKTVVVSSPAAWDALRNDFSAHGADIKAQVLHSAEFLAQLLKQKKLPLTKAGAVSGEQILYPLASDFLKNYNTTRFDAHETLARELGVTLKPFGFNSEESYTVGEGAVVLDRLNPKLVGKLAAYIAERVNNPDRDVLLTFSPYTKYALLSHAGRPLRVVTVEELTNQRIKE